MHRVLGSTISKAVAAFQSAWAQAFPMPSPDDPNMPPTIAKAAALREGALLKETVDAIAKKNVA
jgi:hypothetical protein